MLLTVHHTLLYFLLGVVMACFHLRSSGIFYLVACRNGKRIWRSTGVKDRKQAEEVARSLFPELMARWARMTASRFALRHFPYAQADFAPSTVRLYRGALEAFLSQSGSRT